MRLVAPLLWLERLADGERGACMRACVRCVFDACVWRLRNGKFSPIDLETTRPITGILLAIEEVAHSQFKLAHTNWKFALVPKRTARRRTSCKEKSAVGVRLEQKHANSVHEAIVRQSAGT